MNLLDQTREICKLYNIRPSRSKGQNFLIAENVYDEIIKAADLSKDDTVLEVGPGLGFLTAKLAKAAGKVIAVELDDKLAAYLRDAISANETDNVEIINENILDFEMKKIISNFKFPISNFKIVANLPYNITSVFLRKFLTAEHKPELMVLLLQKEVAERICAHPPRLARREPPLPRGESGKMSLLALGVQFYAEPEIIAYVPKNNFWPEPAVDSAIIKIKCHCRPRSHARINSSGKPVNGAKGDIFAPGTINEKDFFRLAKFGFSAKRKMLKNNLAGGLRIAPAEAEKILVAAGLNPKARAEDLSLEDWIKLVSG